MNIVRRNLLNIKGYTPYCGSELCEPRSKESPSRWPRTVFNGKQFICPKCKWESKFPNDFIEDYLSVWNIKN